MIKAANVTRLFSKRDEGQAAFEFLLVLPILVLFFLIVIDFGIVMYEYVSVSNSVREGARFGAVNCSTGSCTADQIKAKVVSRSGGIITSTADVSVGWNDVTVLASGNTNHDRGDAVAVKVSHKYDFLFFPISWTISSCSDMRLEQRDNAATGGGSVAC